MKNDDDAPSTPGVAFPPPLPFAGALALGLVAGRGAARDPGRTRLGNAVGIASAIAGFGLVALARVTMLRAKTNTSPYAPSLALCESGPFRYTRNPIYVGFTSIYIGVAMRLRSQPAFVLLPIVLALVDRYVVDREERYLQSRFGDAYRDYCGHVPRWF